MVPAGICTERAAHDDAGAGDIPGIAQMAGIEQMLQQRVTPGGWKIYVQRRRAGSYVFRRAPCVRQWPTPPPPPPVPPPCERQIRMLMGSAATRRMERDTRGPRAIRAPQFWAQVESACGRHADIGCHARAATRHDDYRPSNSAASSRDQALTSKRCN